MMNNKKKPTTFKRLNNEDDKALDLTMFTITNLTLDNDEENRDMVVMTLKLKRKIVTELLTTYLPTNLLHLACFNSCSVFLIIGLFQNLTGYDL